MLWHMQQLPIVSEKSSTNCDKHGEYCSYVVAPVLSVFGWHRITDYPRHSRNLSQWQRIGNSDLYTTDTKTRSVIEVQINPIQQANHSKNQSYNHCANDIIYPTHMTLLGCLKGVVACNIIKIIRMYLDQPKASILSCSPIHSH